MPKIISINPRIIWINANVVAKLNVKLWYFDKKVDRGFNLEAQCSLHEGICNKIKMPAIKAAQKSNVCPKNVI